MMLMLMLSVALLAKYDAATGGKGQVTLQVYFVTRSGRLHQQQQQLNALMKAFPSNPISSATALLPFYLMCHFKAFFPTLLWRRMLRGCSTLYPVCMPAPLQRDCSEIIDILDVVLYNLHFLAKCTALEEV